MKNLIKVLVKSLLFIVFVAMVIIGQKTIGRPYLLMQLVGVAGILALLWQYNRKFV